MFYEQITKIVELRHGSCQKAPHERTGSAYSKMSYALSNLAMFALEVALVTHVLVSSKKTAVAKTLVSFLIVST